MTAAPSATDLADAVRELLASARPVVAASVRHTKARSKASDLLAAFDAAQKATVTTSDGEDPFVATLTKIFPKAADSATPHLAAIFIRDQLEQAGFSTHEVPGGLGR